MNDELSPTPDIVLASGDPGDDTARRFRYQWAYAGIMCSALLDEDEDTIEVYCEHHEDILLKHRDNKFSGIQIKTRESDQPPWKTTDEAVVKSCCRFAKLESEFPGNFKTFRFLTNHPFFSSTTGSSLQYVLGEVTRDSDSASLAGPAATFVNKIVRQSGCTIESVLSALKKMRASDDLPKLRDIQSRLVDALAAVWEKGGNSTNEALHRAARHLVAECQNASSLAHENLLPAYMPAISIDDEEVKARIDGKMFDRSRVISCLEVGLNVVALLEGGVDLPGEGQQGLLLKKLDAGGFSIVSRNSAVDLRNKTEHLGIGWLQKYGNKKGLAQYSHVRSSVLSDSADAFERTKNNDKKFGLEMLAELRKQLKLRRDRNEQLFDCTNEHLEGFAYVLTSLCQVQWSIDRPWEEE